MKFTKLKLNILAITMATVFTAAAEQEVRVKDFIDANSNKAGLRIIDPSESLAFNYNGQESLIIRGYTPEEGERPWIITGENDAFMLAGELIREPSEFTKLGNQVYFTADSPTYGEELFTVVDGEVELVLNIRPGGNSRPEQLTSYNGYLYFVANDGGGQEIWRTNGNTTEKVTNLEDNDSVNAISNFTLFGGWLYFTADTAQKGNELYRTNGTDVILHAELGAFQDDGVQPDSILSVYDNRLFFSGFFIDQVGFDMHFVQSDHSAPVFFSEFIAGNDPTIVLDAMIGDDGEQYWVIDNAGNQEMWHYDGINAATKKVSQGDIELLAAFDGGMYFANDGILPANGMELYKIVSGAFAQVDGVDGEPFELHTGSRGSDPRSPVVIGDTFYFMANATNYGHELLKIEAGSFQADIAFEDLAGPFASLTEVAKDVSNNIYLVTGQNRRLVQFDTNTLDINDVTPNQATGVDSSLTYNGDGQMIEYKGRLYFTAYTEEQGTELWVTNGQNEHIVSDIYNGKVGSHPSDFVIYQDELYFVASSSAGGREVWKTDGQTLEQAFEIVVGAESSFPSHLTLHNDWLFFRATNVANGSEIFATNGTDIELVADVLPGPSSSNPNHLTSFNNKLWFSAKDANDGFELWEIDENLVLTKHDLVQGNTGSKPSQFHATESYLYFRVLDNNGIELWTTDGDTILEMAEDINPGADSSHPSHLITDNDDRVYFIANNGTNKRLYRASGTSVVEINVSPVGDFIDLEYVNDRFYALINNPDTGTELYGRVGNDFSLLDEVINGPASALGRIKATQGTLLGEALHSSYVLNIINHAEAEWKPLSHENDEAFKLSLNDNYIAGYDFGKTFVVPACNNKLGCELFSVYFNEKPEVAIEGPIEAHSGVEVMLDGSNSFDLDGEISEYIWTRVSGPNVVLPNNGSGTLSFKAPDLLGEEDLVVRLKVIDNDGAESYVEHSIKIFNAAPVAIINVSNANPESEQQVTLDGSSSTDDTVIGAYQWTQITGPAVSLENANSSVASFTAIDVEADTLVEFQLTVTDENGISHSQTVAIVISPMQSENQAPNALISVSNLSPTSGSLVTLDASASNDVDGSITSYEWVQLDGVAINLDNNIQVSTSFVAPAVQEPTIVTVQLTVVDDAEASTQASVQIQIMPADAENQAPSAMIQVSNVNPDAGENVTMDASGSSDSDGVIVSYAWVQVAGPAVTLSDANSNIASFIAPEVDEDTQLQFKLTIMDDEGASVVSSVFVNLKAKPNVLPIANVSASNMNPVSGTQVDLTGDTSVDGDGQIVSYQWSVTEGPNTEIANANSANASFIAPIVNQNTAMTFKLTVTDDDGGIAEKTISITVLPQLSPNNPNTPISNSRKGGGSTSLFMILALLGICMGRRRI